ncbi:sensor histidine kinase [Alloalcanivorax mobilis]|uniref:sensor histidine kinase n=1 Tax=Alloalcanivorax mobilis TaxID=2019569 RepID=UPI001E43134B|nr:sensor histidine kinase [Alloalcanivorax mobilis]
MLRPMLLWLAWLCCAGVHAQTVAPSSDQTAITVARFMDVLVDPEGSWDFNQVRGEFAGRFAPNAADEPNFGFTGSVIWLRFTLDLSAARAHNWYLVERYPILDHITLFKPDQRNHYQRVEMGDTLPFSHRMMDHRAFVFPLDTSIEGPRVYYVKVSGKGAINLSPMLYSAEGLVEYTYRDTLIYGVFYGCLLIMVVYNALLALSLREPVYLYFVAFLAGILLFNLNINGFGLQFVWPNLPRLNEYYWLGIYICTPALAMYSRHFLSLKQRFVRYDRLLRHYLAALGVLLVVQLLIPPPWSYYLSTLVVLITVLLFSWLGWMVWARGYQAARLYVAAWSVFLLLIFIFVLGNLGWVPYATIITMLPHIGALWVVVMLSLALGDRIRFLERERSQLFIEARQNLERHVREIEQMNRDKSTFLQYVSHELNTPINWLGAAHSANDDGAERDVWALVRKGQQRLMGMVATSLRYFDLADRDGSPLLARCSPRRLLDDTLAGASGALRERNLTVHNHIDADLQVRANETELREVLAMALDNAIRFSEPGGRIELTSTARGERAEIRVRDDGRGAHESQLESLFEPFFVVGSRHHEEGYGLSLAMARVMIEQTGGRIWAESDGPGKGFMLVIRLDAEGG